MHDHDLCLWPILACLPGNSGTTRLSFRKFLSTREQVSSTYGVYHLTTAHDSTFMALTMQDSITESKTINYILFMIFAIY